MSLEDFILIIWFFSGNSGIASPTPAPINSGLKTGNAAGLYDNRNYAIIRKVEDVGLDGYHYL